MTDLSPLNEAHALSIMIHEVEPDARALFSELLLSALSRASRPAIQIVGSATHGIVTNAMQEDKTGAAPAVPATLDAFAALALGIEARFGPYERGKPVSNNSDNTPPDLPPGSIYIGTLIGNNANIGLGNDVRQQQSIQVAPEYQPLAKAVVKALEELRLKGIDKEDLEFAESSGGEILAEVSKDKPDKTLIRRALNALRGVVTQVGARAATGALQAEQEWVQNTLTTLANSVIPS